MEKEIKRISVDCDFSVTWLVMARNEFISTFGFTPDFINISIEAIPAMMLVQPLLYMVAPGMYFSVERDLAKYAWSLSGVKDETMCIIESNGA